MEREFLMREVLEYIEQNQQRFLEELKDFIRIPSVSAQSAHDTDVQKCATWLKDHLKNLGLHAEIIETKGHPIVRAGGGNGPKNPSAKRLIIYGHYDVQPDDPLDQWKSPPFEPEIRDGFLYARGATDDKGQLFCHIKAVEALLQTRGKLPCEVLFLVEGEEETNGDSLAEYIRQQKAELAQNLTGVVISDCSMYDENTPAITYGLRGIVAMEVQVKGPIKDVHSGTYGGVVGNPAIALANIIAQCISTEGRILIPGFYDDVRQLEDFERDNYAQLNFDDQGLKKELSLRELFGERDFTTLERAWARPTFEINGIFGGYTGQGNKTIIPATANAKITIRLVADQDPKKIGKLVKNYLQSICPDYVNIQVTEPSGEKPVLIDVNDPLVQAGMEALKQGFGQDAAYIRCGGSIPVVDTFWRELQKCVLLMGFGLDTDGAHSPNERFRVESFFKGIKTSACLLDNV